MGRRVISGLAVAVVAAGLALATAVLGDPDGAPPLASSPDAGRRDVAGAEAATASTTVVPVVVDHRLFVVGDSVLQGASAALVEQLDDWELTVDTRVGRFLDEGIRVVRRHRRDLSQVVLVGLGNNYGGDAAAFASEVDEMLEGLAAVDHVFWLTVAEFRPDRADVNAVLRAAAARDRRVRLVDWNEVWADDVSLTARDLLHLTPAGAERMAQLVASELQRSGLRPRAGAGRSTVVTGGTLPPGADGAVGDAPATRRITTTAVAPTTTALRPPITSDPGLVTTTTVVDAAADSDAGADDGVAPPGPPSSTAAPPGDGASPP